MMEARIVLSTIADKELGESLLTQLVSEGLIACGNLVAAGVSIYQWEGKIEKTDECLLILKTQLKSLEKLEEQFHLIHPYEVPEFVVLTPESISSPYLRWLLANSNGC